MEPMQIPPFERLYERHADEVLPYLRRITGADAAEDAFQETFVRALRGYPRLRSAANLCAWLFTIATRVVIDEHRRSNGTPGALPEIAVVDVMPPHRDIEHLTSLLPPIERAAVTLRYGYDLSYEEIGSALGSSEGAARQAASSGVRRLRRHEARRNG